MTEKDNMSTLKFQRLKVLESGKIVTRLGTIITEAHGRRLIVLKRSLPKFNAFVVASLRADIHCEIISDVFFKAGKLNIEIKDNNYCFNEAIRQFKALDPVKDFERWETSAGAKKLAINLDTDLQVKEFLNG